MSDTPPLSQNPPLVYSNFMPQRKDMTQHAPGAANGSAISIRAELEAMKGKGPIASSAFAQYASGFPQYVQGHDSRGAKGILFTRLPLFPVGRNVPRTLTEKVVVACRS